jgi:hypothetical protein
MRYLRLLPFLAAIAATAASAQQIALFEHDNFSGRTLAADHSVQNLQTTGFNDLASSAVVRGGSWQVCSDAYFRGKGVTLGPGIYPSLRAMGLNDRVSSVREIGWGGAASTGNVDGAIVLYDGNDLTGRPFALNGPVSNFATTGFNDRAQSLEIRRGTWLLCSDANFQGRCREFGPGRYPDLRVLDNRVSSARPVSADASATTTGGAWGGGRTRVVLDEGPNFGGRAFTIDSNYVANLGNTGFNDRASSLRVERGYWIFCSDANFQGECRTLGPGDYAALPSGLSNRISSARRISDDYPYNSAPNWQYRGAPGRG